MSDSYCMRKELVGVAYPDAVERVTEALAGEGFGVLTEIDVKETFKAKLDVDFRPYVILGACNPPLAYQAISGESDVGLLLPCNVVVEEADAGSRVSIARPQAMLGLADLDTLNAVADEAEERLRRVLEAI